MTMATTLRLSRGIDAAIAIPLLAFHVALAWGATLFVGFAVNTMRSCGGGVCPDTQWVGLAVIAAGVALVALPVIDLGGIIVALSMRRTAWIVPLAMCGIHVAYTVLLLVLLAQAGRR